jgi:hypothetical protein
VTLDFTVLAGWTTAWLSWILSSWDSCDQSYWMIFWCRSSCSWGEWTTRTWCWGNQTSLLLLVSCVTDIPCSWVNKGRRFMFIFLSFGYRGEERSPDLRGKHFWGSFWNWSGWWELRNNTVTGDHCRVLILFLHLELAKGYEVPKDWLKITAV